MSKLNKILIEMLEIIDNNNNNNNTLYFYSAYYNVSERFTKLYLNNNTFNNYN